MMDRVLISIPLSQDPVRRSASEQLLCNILRYAPNGTFLKRKANSLCLAVPEQSKCHSSQFAHPVSLWDEFRPIVRK